MLTIALKNNLREYAPRQSVEGTAGGQMPDVPHHVVLRLFWYTEGRGTQDTGIVAEKEWIPAAANFQEDFLFALPDAPYSFHGKLISLCWGLELIVNHGKDVERVDLSVSPWLQIPQLDTKPSPFNTSPSGQIRVSGR